MPIYFSAIAMEKLILATCASYSGNFIEVTSAILPSIPPGNKKFSFSSDNYSFHYVMKKRIWYFCITDIQFSHTKAFLFLNEVKAKHLESLGDLPVAMLPYALLTRFNDGEFERILKSQMRRYNNNVSLDNITAQLEELDGIMEQNVHKLMARGEQLQTLEHRSAELESSALLFKRCAVHCHFNCWWKNVRICWYVFIVLVLLSSIYLVGATTCGGLKWPACV